MKGNVSDIELIRQVLRENNPRAFDTLMQRYSLPVYNAALRLMHDEDDAAEVTQLAFIQAYKQLDSWHGGNFGAWVTIIANHIALRLLEKEKRRGDVRFDDVQSTTDLADIADGPTTSSERHICKPWSKHSRYCPKPTDRSSDGTITRTCPCK